MGQKLIKQISTIMNKKGAGRKPLDNSEKRHLNLKVRVREDELTIIQDLHNKSPFDNVSEMVRHILLRNPIPVEIANADFRDLSSNLNILAEDLYRMSRSRSPKLENFQEQIKALTELVYEAIKKMQEVKTLELTTKELNDFKDWKSKDLPYRQK